MSYRTMPTLTLAKSEASVYTASEVRARLVGYALARLRRRAAERHTAGIAR
jgi:hypothetical protein